ncbi:MAG: Gfo/Idh/MocA family oxidoreductase [Spirochaetes bacterium]|nr:Gfo/Idh/MocA family oxidoreductase [Spirochaetota bacterium]
MLKVAIIGCGKIADLHTTLIQRIPDCKIIGVCDKEKLMARQLAERIGITDYYDDINKLLESKKPDVVHITTPPQSHYKLGEICLKAGCNPYIEKPFTVNYEEAKKLIDLANEKNLKITVGHSAQFSPVAIQLRKLVNEGYLGGDPIHMNSIFTYFLGDGRFAKALLEDKTHWVRYLPGQLLHNIISHGVSKITEFINCENPKVIASGFTSKILKNIGEHDLIDELRVIIHDNDNTTGYFTFSTQMSPSMHQFHIYGPKNSIFIDNITQTLIKHDKSNNYKSYLNCFIPQRNIAKQYKKNSKNNIKQFLKKKFYADSWIQSLIENFYNSVAKDSPLPIRYNEILLTAKILDDIFEQIKK